MVSNLKSRLSVILVVIIRNIYTALLEGIVELCFIEIIQIRNQILSILIEEITNHDLNCEFKVVIKMMPICFQDDKILLLLRKAQNGVYDFLNFRLTRSEPIESFMKNELKDIILEKESYEKLLAVESEAAKRNFLQLKYYAIHQLVKERCLNVITGSAYKWFDVKEVLSDESVTTEIKMDLKSFFVALEKELIHEPILYYLLPKEFTIPEMYQLVQQLKNTTLNRGNFYRKLQSLPFLEKLHKKKPAGAHKSPDVYRIDLMGYHKYLKENLLIF